MRSSRKSIEREREREDSERKREIPDPHSSSTQLITQKEHEPDQSALDLLVRWNGSGRIPLQEEPGAYRL